MNKQEYEMKYLELRLKMLAELWQKLLRQGFVVTFLVVIVCALSYAVVWLHNHSTEEIHALRIEYKADLAEARNETRLCEQERLRQAAVFDEKIQGLRETVERLTLKKK